LFGILVKLIFFV